MNSSQRHLALVASIALLSLSSCGTPATDNSRSSNTSSPTPSESPLAPSSPSPTATPPATEIPATTKPARPSPTSSPGSSTVDVTIYKPDNQCEAFVSEKVAVSAQQPMQGAIGKIIEQGEGEGFDLAGYRLEYQPDRGVATIDLRLAPGSKRQFVSLSSCEQLALFGSLRKTLTSNPQWKVDTVRFTERGEEIIL